MKIEQGERGGKPSASSMDIIVGCPGSHRQSRYCRGIESAAATSGKRVHDATDTGDIERLDETEAELVARNQAIADRITAEKPGAKTYGEKRLWYEILGERLFSGKVDRVWVDRENNLAVVLDFKTGWRREDELDPAYDWQLRAYAVLAANHYDVDTVMVGFYLPRFRKEVWARYERRDITIATSQMHEIVGKSNDVLAPLRPGKHCKYCPAKMGCSAYQSAIVQFLPTFNLAEADSDQLKEWAVKGELIKQMLPVNKAVNEELKTRLQRGDDLPWAKLKEGVAKRKITNPVLAYNLMSEIVEEKHLNEALSLAVGKLELAYYNAINKAGNVTKAQAKTRLNALLAAFIETTKSEPSVQIDWSEL